VFHISEKHLGQEHWQINGKDRGGCHFLFMICTQNESRQGVDAHERRQNKAANMQKKTGAFGRAGK
jgi:hypothetical protein